MFLDKELAVSLTVIFISSTSDSGDHFPTPRNPSSRLHLSSFPPPSPHTHNSGLCTITPNWSYWSSDCELFGGKDLAFTFLYIPGPQHSTWNIVGAFKILIALTSEHYGIYQSVNKVSLSTSYEPDTQPNTGISCLMHNLNSDHIHLLAFTISKFTTLITVTMLPNKQWGKLFTHQRYLRRKDRAKEQVN